MLIAGARSMLIVGAALFINRHTNCQHNNVDGAAPFINGAC